MRPGGFRNDWRFVGCSAVALALATTTSAQAAPLSSTLVGNAPLAIALGAAAFAALATLVLRQRYRDSRLAGEQAAGQIADLRAQLDSCEALLSSAREVTVLWPAQGGSPRIFGQTLDLLPAGRRLESMLDFSQWLAGPQADRLARAVEALRAHGESFALSLDARTGQSVRLQGAALGGAAVLRIRPLAEPAGAGETPEAPDEAVRSVLGGLGMPAFLRDRTGEVTFSNTAYDAIWPRDAGSRTASLAQLADSAAQARHFEALAAGNRPPPLPLSLPAGRFELVEMPLPSGSAGYLRAIPAAAPEVPQPTREGRVAALVSALSIPAAIFDAQYQLIAFNRAYADLWKLGDWLKPGLDERTILDRLRREGLLPSEPDYRAWRTTHLASYQLRSKGSPEPWHLPDGRTLEVTAAPAGPDGGVIYLFEDISRELELMSQNRALASVQRSTLNALSDAVAVFGTNGRLQLFNPRLSALWRLPTNFLEQNPHIDQVAAAAAAELPEDGAAVWRDLKRSVIDLTPTRTDTHGRLTLSDGRLLDYAVVRLPDGQKLMSFLDVTESANYNRMLKERNDALVTADRLKDAFVQNVSYELRSPLTNIIGFADLLASPEVGPLNERQRTYTDYIRASSVTLGVLIDNILDLATVDAGIAELRPEPQDVATLVEKARTGLAATFPEIGGGTSINLKVSIDPDLPPLIADGTRIVQVLYNLLSSAARFSEPGGEVRLSATARGGRILFVVEDDGAISEEMRAELLQAPEGVVGRQRGAGLGLAIVRAFVNLHGGTITVEARKPRGTRVVVSLPRDASAAATTAAE
jgi:signal transduction histidine kinase